jgi:hypothetical protein
VKTFEIIINKTEVSPKSSDSLKSSPKISRRYEQTRTSPIESSRSVSRSINPLHLKGLISTIMNRNLGIKVHEETCSPENSKTAKYFRLKEKRDHSRKKNDVIIDFITDPLHYKSEYLTYLFDVGKNVLMEKYIGQNLLKKRKQMKFLNGFNKLK